MTSAPIEIKRIHGFGYNADTVRSWIHAEGPLARNSWFGYKCVVVDTAQIEPVSSSNSLLAGNLAGNFLTKRLRGQFSGLKRA
jgi:hypothetical protein